LKAHTHTRGNCFLWWSAEPLARTAVHARGPQGPGCVLRLGWVLFLPTGGQPPSRCAVYTRGPKGPGNTSPRLLRLSMFP
jgi:hypothetical protein